MTVETQEVESTATTDTEPVAAAIETAPEPAAPAPAPSEKPISIREALDKAAKALDRGAKDGAPAIAKPQETKPQDKPATGTARDAAGRFAAAAQPQGDAPAKPAAQATAAEGEAAKPAAAAESEARAPQSWRPAVRELAGKLPAEFKPVLEEANRRERETAVALQQAAEGRKFGDGVRQAIAPFEAVFHANGVDPVTGIHQLARTAYVLNTGAPAQRAQAIAGMVRTFLGTDEGAIGLLAQAIDGAPAGPGPRAAPVVDPRAIAQQVRQEIMAEAQSRLVDQKVVEVDEFAKTHPFFHDVRNDMAALATAYGQLGRKITLEQAYDLAVSGNSELSAIVKQREAAKSAATAQAATTRTEAAASSVRSQPAGPAVRTGQAMSRQDALRQAAADVSGRGRV